MAGRMKEALKESKMLLVFWIVVTLLVSAFSFITVLVGFSDMSSNLLGSILGIFTLIASLAFPLYIPYSLFKKGFELKESLVPVLVGWIGNTIIVGASSLLVLVVTLNSVSSSSGNMGLISPEEAALFSLAYVIIGAVFALFRDVFLGAVGFFVGKVLQKK